MVSTRAEPKNCAAKSTSCRTIRRLCSNAIIVIFRIGRKRGERVETSQESGPMPEYCAVFAAVFACLTVGFERASTELLRYDTKAESPPLPASISPGHSSGCRIYPHRTVGRDRHHRNPGGNVVAVPGASQGIRLSHSMHGESEAVGTCPEDLRGG